ncbi:hypothetical protein KM043_011518 [Ampulex compressa]|nr:hypothetical protein KM043_011518 [Ampulex compressa]
MDASRTVNPPPLFLRTEKRALPPRQRVGKGAKCTARGSTRFGGSFAVCRPNLRAETAARGSGTAKRVGEGGCFGTEFDPTVEVLFRHCDNSNNASLTGTVRKEEGRESTTAGVARLASLLRSIRAACFVTTTSAAFFAFPGPASLPSPPPPPSAVLYPPVSPWHRRGKSAGVLEYVEKSPPRPAGNAQAISA